MEKEEIIKEVQRVSSVLSPAEIEPFYSEIMDKTDSNYIPFYRNRDNMMGGITSKLNQLKKKQVEEFLFRVKEAAEARLVRQERLVKALSDLELPTIDTEVPMSDKDDIWEPYLLRAFLDRFGCIANEVTYSVEQDDFDEDEFDSEEEEWSPACTGITGPDPLASACAKMFQSAYFMTRAKCDEYEEKLRSDGYPEEDIKELSDAFGYGISDGIKRTFREQHFQELDSGLHLIVPQPIKDYKEFCDEEIDVFNVMLNPYPPTRLNPIYTKGVDFGLTFDPSNPPSYPQEGE